MFVSAALPAGAQEATRARRQVRVLIVLTPAEDSASATLVYAEPRRRRAGSSIQSDHTMFSANQNMAEKGRRVNALK
jgi:hypothetical protein